MNPDNIQDGSKYSIWSSELLIEKEIRSFGVSPQFNVRNCFELKYEIISNPIIGVDKFEQIQYFKYLKYEK